MEMTDRQQYALNLILKIKNHFVILKKKFTNVEHLVYDRPWRQSVF